MTVLSLPAQPRQDGPPRPVPWRRMAWVTWRQHRPTLISVPAVLGVVALFLLIMGLKIHHDYAILGARQSSPSTTTDWTVTNTVLILMNFAPLLIGAFAGAPVLARELETGTFRYAWTQGFGRVRWTVAKLVQMAVVLAVSAGALGTLFAWFAGPAMQHADLSVADTTVFATRGLAFPAWTLAAFAIGVFLGMLVRRVIAALALTFGAWFGLDLLTWLVLRKLYLPAATQHAVTIGQHQVYVLTVPQFWSAQFIEAGWLLTFAVLLTAATTWLVRRRAA